MMPRPQHLLGLVLLTALLGSCITGALALRGAEAGEQPNPLGRFDPYLHRTSGAPADPVNLVFQGADSASVARAIQRVLGWQQVAGSAMLFDDRGGTRTTAWQFGLPLSPLARLHLRIEAARTARGEPYVLAGVHRDDTTACGHVGHDFNRSRDTVARAFARLGYTVTQVHLGNTHPGRQCDHSMTAGDGTVAVIDLRSGRLPAGAPLFPVGSSFLPPMYLSLP